MPKRKQLIIADKLVDVTPEVIAELFAHLDNFEQAQFFNECAKIGTAYGNFWPMQLQYITDEDGLTLEGRRCMQMIGEYSHWGLVPKAKELPKLQTQKEMEDEWDLSLGLSRGY